MYLNPYVLDVSELDETQRRALAESVVGAYPTLTVDEDFLPEQESWTLRKSPEATEEDWEEEVEYIEAVFEDAKKGVLVPVEDSLPWGTLGQRLDLAPSSR